MPTSVADALAQSQATFANDPLMNGSMTGTGAGSTSSPGMSTTQALQQAFGGGGIASQLGTLTAQSNLNAYNYDQELANMVNQTNQLAQNTLNTGNLPGGAALQGQAVGDTSAELAGQLSPGTVSTIEDSMAQQYGAGAGFGADSASISAAAERAMGLTSEGQVQAGMGNLSTLNAEYPRPALYGAQSGFVSPADVASLGMAQANALQGGGNTGGTGGSVPRGTTGTTGGGGGGGSSIPAAGYPTQTGGYGGGYAGSGTTGMTGTTAAPAGTTVQDPNTGQTYVNNGDGTWTDTSTGQMQQYAPDIANTSYNPFNDTAYNNYGVDTSGFNPTYYDPTSGASASTPDGSTALQNYWLGPNQDWSSYLGASDQPSASPSDWSMTDYSGGE